MTFEMCVTCVKIGMMKEREFENNSMESIRYLKRNNKKNVSGGIQTKLIRRYATQVSIIDRFIRKFFL